MLKPKVVVVTFCKNEAKFIGGCVDSIQQQTLKPTVHVVVDDGSTDGTRSILASLVLQKKIALAALDTRPQPHSRGVHTLNLFRIGSEIAEAIVPDWDFLLKVDADEYLPKNYIALLIGKMLRHPTLGITGGVPLVLCAKSFIKPDYAPYHVSDGAKLYRRECYDQVARGFIPERYGWDTFLWLKAKQHGWYIRAFDDITFFEQRPSLWEKNELSLHSWIRTGICRSYLGFPLMYHVMSTMMRLRHKPLVIGGVTFLEAYIIHRLLGSRNLSKAYYKHAREHILDILLHKLRRRRIMRHFAWMVRK